MNKYTKSDILDNFGQLLIAHVRDVVFQHFEDLSSGKCAGERYQDLYKKINNLEPALQEVLGNLVLDIIDSSVHHFLWIFEQNEEYDLIRYNEDDTYTSLRDISDGLHGELYTEEGWIQKFSTYSPSIIMEPIKQLAQNEEVVKAYSTSPEEAKRLLLRIMSNRENFQKFKDDAQSISPSMLQNLVDMIMSTSTVHQVECQEIIKIINSRSSS